MHVISLREHLERDVPRCDASLCDEPDHLRLPILKRAEVAVEKFFVVVDRLSMTTVDERRGELSQARQADQVFRERRKSPRRIDRIG